MSHEEILAALQEQFPDEVVEQAPGLNFTVVVKPERLVELATFLRDQAGMDFLSNLTAVDRPDRFEVVYHLYSTKNPAPPFALKVMLPDKANPRLPSVTSVWEGANFQEREAYDLLGIVFDGHPKLERLLLWDGFPGHPLRKDFVNRTFTFEEISRTLPPDDKR